MLGLVLADDLLLLYVFWELTTVFSYLLIGGGRHAAGRPGARRSQALILTTAGGLAMLVGLIMLGETSGSYLLSEVVAAPGRAAPVAGRRHRAACWSARSPSRRSSRSTSGCRPRWRRRPRSAPTCTPRRW